MSEEITKPGTRESDENFLRITGQKRLRAVDRKTFGGIEGTYSKGSSQPLAANLSDLYGAKKLCQTLRSRGQQVPVWISDCDGA